MEYIDTNILIKPRRACTARVTVVGFICVFFNRDLTSGVSVCPENDIMYSMGNEGQKICVDFSENCSVAEICCIV